MAEPRTFVPLCPVCSSLMQPAYPADDQQLFACDGCLTTLTVRVGSWAVALESQPTEMAEENLGHNTEGDRNVATIRRRVDIGTALALSVFTLTKPSFPEILHEEFPIVCVHCGRQSVTPIANGTKVQVHELQLAMACDACGEGWLARVSNDPLILGRKVDRRAAPRGLASK